MASPQPIPETTLLISRTLPARREEVFRAWTDPQALARWFAPSDEYKTTVPVFDFRPGGRYRIVMRKDGEDHIVCGVFHEIRGPEKLVFTWRWETKPMEDTFVTVELHDRGASTELVLVHERLTPVDFRDRHEHGWIGCLDQLGRYLSERSTR